MFSSDKLIILQLPVESRVQKIDNVVSRFSVENFETTFFISKLATTNLTRYDWNKQNARLFDRAEG